MKKKFSNTSELPSDPMEMPPPYWRSPGTIFHLELSVEEIVSLLKELLEMHPAVEKNLTDYFKKKPVIEEDDLEFIEIYEPLSELETKIIQKVIWLTMTQFQNILAKLKGISSA